MKMNFNKIQVNIEGESHSERLNVEIKGLPADVSFDREELQAFMDRRHGDGSYICELVGTGRHEPDVAEFDELGEVIKAHIDNKDVRSKDYDKLRTVLRPGHADLGAFLKYGAEGLKPGGGEFSGRMTAAMCLAGGIAKQLLEKQGVEIDSYILQMGGMTTAFLDEEDEAEFFQRIEEIAESGDSCGAIIGCVVKNYPCGIGGPGMDGLEGDLARAMLAIPSAKGVEFGSGFEGSYWRGSRNNDEYFLSEGRIVSRSNKQGGISGGISTGMNITCNVAFKPVPSIGLEQRTVDIEKMEETVINIEGRHDVCIAPRVMPVVEAMAALVLYDRLIAEWGAVMAEKKYEGMNLEELREQIDAVDKELMEKFRERMALSAEIAKFKKANGMPILDVEREKLKLNKIAKNVEDELSGFTSKLYLTLADLSKVYQGQILDMDLDDIDLEEDDL